MSFKSYTRKSSALIGADRAGVSRDCVVEVEGKWGFYEGGFELPSAESFEAEPEVTAPVVAQTVKNVKRTSDRRKLKRFLYRQLETVRKGSMPRYLKDSMSALLRRDLRNCYKRINNPVAI